MSDLNLTVQEGGDIYLSISETPAVVTLSQPVVSGALSSTVTVANTVTVALDSNSLSALENVTVTVGAAVSVSNFPASQTIAGTVTANGGDFLNSDDALITKDSAKNVVLIGGLEYSTTPTLSQIQAFRTQGDGTLKIYQEVTNWTDTNQGNQPRAASQQTPFPVQIIQDSAGSFSSAVTANLGSSVTIGFLPAISGTVTANVVGKYNVAANIFTDKNILTDSTGQTLINASVNGQSVFSYDGQAHIFARLTPSSSVTIGSLPAISGTVTVGAMPSGALTTRFGSVTTANTAQLTSAVTNTSRKYLLVQNIATSTVTIGIGFAPTTTQGIQLTAGAGLTFDAFCPTGGVWWLSSTTGSNFSILEG